MDETREYPTRALSPTPVLLRLVVYPGEVYRLPETGHCVRVTAGHAWLSYQGQDVCLVETEAARLPVSAEPALLSAMGQRPLVVELLN